MAEIIGLGALNWDRLFLVDRFANPGEEIVIKEVHEEAGGSAANTIAALGRLGVECEFIGKVGSDAEGENILRSFDDESVDAKGVIKERGKTGTVFAFIDRMGERTMYVNPGVNDSLSLKDLSTPYIQSSRYLHLSSFAGGSSLEMLKEIPRLKGDVKLSFSPGFLSQKGVSFLKPILKSCDILFLNEHEAHALTDEKPLAAGQALNKIGVDKVVVTLGGKGSLVMEGTGSTYVEGVSVKAVDTTGAGDAFSAGFLYGILRDFDSLTCGRIGNFVASRCIQFVGARKGLPKRGDVEEFLRNAKFIKSKGNR